MSPRKMLTLLSLLVLIGSAQAQTTDPGPRKDRFWSTGIFGAFGPGTNMTFFPGALVGWSSNIREYNVGTDLRFTWPKDDALQWPPDEPDVLQYGFIFWSLTARRFLSYGNIVPVIGAGINLAVIYGRSNHSGGSISDGSRTGFGAHVTLGAEMFRLAKSRLRLEARVDFPFYKSHLSNTRGRRLESSYVMPISIGISYHR